MGVLFSFFEQLLENLIIDSFLEYVLYVAITISTDLFTSGEEVHQHNASGISKITDHIFTHLIDF